MQTFGSPPSVAGEASTLPPPPLPSKARQKVFREIGAIALVDVLLNNSDRFPLVHENQLRVVGEPLPSPPFRGNLGNVLVMGSGDDVELWAVDNAVCSLNATVNKVWPIGFAATVCSSLRSQIGAQRTIRSAQECIAELTGDNAVNSAGIRRVCAAITEWTCSGFAAAVAGTESTTSLAYADTVIATVSDRAAMVAGALEAAAAVARLDDRLFGDLHTRLTKEVSVAHCCCEATHW